MKVDELKWLIDADFGTDPDPPSYALGFAVFFFQPGSIAGIAGPSRLIAGSVSVGTVAQHALRAKGTEVID